MSVGYSIATAHVGRQVWSNARGAHAHATARLWLEDQSPACSRDGRVVVRSPVAAASALATIWANCGRSIHGTLSTAAESLRTWFARRTPTPGQSRARASLRLSCVMISASRPLGYHQRPPSIRESAGAGERGPGILTGGLRLSLLAPHLLDVAATRPPTTLIVASRTSSPSVLRAARFERLTILAALIHRILSRSMLAIVHDPLHSCSYHIAIVLLVPLVCSRTRSASPFPLLPDHSLEPHFSRQ